MHKQSKGSLIPEMNNFNSSTQIVFVSAIYCNCSQELVKWHTPCKQVHVYSNDHAAASQTQTCWNIQFDYYNFTYENMVNNCTDVFQRIKLVQRPYSKFS